MTELLNLDEIANRLNMRKEYVRDRLRKRPDFPPPSIDLSQRMRRWEASAIDQWANDQAKSLAR